MRINEYREYLHNYKNRKGDFVSDIRIFPETFHSHEGIASRFVQGGTTFHDLITRSVLNSFGQHYLPLQHAYMDNRLEAFLSTEKKFQLTDSHQIFYPKGTNVREWMGKVPKLVPNHLYQVWDFGKNYSIEEGTQLLVSVLRDHFEFNNIYYPCKHTMKNLSLTRLNVDGESYVKPGTGSRRGLAYIFNDKKIENPKYDHKSLLDNLIDEVDLITKNKYLNHEAHTCYFYKYLNYKNGKKPKKIELEWRFPVEKPLQTTLF